jgi:hypothetical protein
MDTIKKSQSIQVRTGLRGGMPSDQMEHVCQAAQTYCEVIQSNGGTDCMCNYLAPRCKDVQIDIPTP